MRLETLLQPSAESTASLCLLLGGRKLGYRDMLQKGSSPCTTTICSGLLCLCRRLLAAHLLGFEPSTLVPPEASRR